MSSQRAYSFDDVFGATNPAPRPSASPSPVLSMDDVFGQASPLGRAAPSAVAPASVPPPDEVDVEEPGMLSRFFTNLRESALPERISDIAMGPLGVLKDAVTGNYGALIDDAALVGGAAVQGATDQFGRAKEAGERSAVLKQEAERHLAAGNIAEYLKAMGTGALEATEAVARTAASAVPLMGPGVAQTGEKVGEQVGEGDIAGALGQITGAVVDPGAVLGLGIRGAKAAGALARGASAAPPIPDLTVPTPDVPPALDVPIPDAPVRPPDAGPAIRPPTDPVPDELDLDPPVVPEPQKAVEPEPLPDQPAPETAIREPDPATVPETTDPLPESGEMRAPTAEWRSSIRDDISREVLDDVRREYPDATPDALDKLARERAGSRLHPVSGLPNKAAQVADEKAGRYTGWNSGDMSGFKDVNDTLGHEAGDAAMVAVADMAMDVAREVAQETGLPNRVYGPGGDEIGIGAGSVEAAELFGKKMAERTAGATFEYTAPDGTVQSHPLPKLDFGGGRRRFRESDAALNARRKVAEDAGERRSRGERELAAIAGPEEAARVFREARERARSRKLAKESSAGGQAGDGGGRPPGANPDGPPGQPPGGDGPPEVGGDPPKGDPVQKLLGLIREAPKAIRETEALRAPERARRGHQIGSLRRTQGGEAFVKAASEAAGGELPRADFDPVRPKLTQEDVDGLFKRITASPELRDWEAFRASLALKNILDPQGGRLPQRSELALLERAFGPEFTDAVLSRRGAWEKFKEGAVDALNVPRAITTSFDLSAPLRQGLILTLSRPSQSGPALKAMGKALFSEDAFRAVERNIRSRPNAQLYDDNGLALTTKDRAAGLSAREERFMSNLAEKIPVMGAVVRASERAHITYLNKLRADVFDAIADPLMKGGVTPETAPSVYKGLAEYINVATGRGQLYQLERVAPLMNAVFFSPRFVSARLQTINPKFYADLPPSVRREAARDMAKMMAAGVTVLGLSQAAGAQVEKDPRSSDFGKIRVGRTRFDIWGGEQQPIRYLAQIISGQRKSSTTGKVTDQRDRTETAGRFVRSKLAPVPSSLVDVAVGENMVGEDVTLGSEVKDLFSPMFLREFYEAAKEYGLLKGAAVSAPGLFGVGVNTYGEKPKR